MSMSEIQRLNEIIGKREERYCGNPNCKRDRVWLFCKVGHSFSADEYYWQCTACKTKDYVKR